MKKKVIILLVVLIIIIFSFTFFGKKSSNVPNHDEINVYTTLEDDTFYVSSESNSSSSLYYIVITNYKKIRDFEMTPTFNQVVDYENSYSEINMYKSLPIEYYLAAETDMNLEEELDDFLLYLAQKEADSPSFEENEEYEEYISDYKSDENYRNIGKGYYAFRVKLDVNNFKDGLVLSNIKYTIKDEDDVSRTVFEKSMDTVFLSNNTSTYGYDHSMVNQFTPQPNNRSIVDYKYQCNGEYKVSNIVSKNDVYKINNVQYEEKGIVKDLPVQCTKGKQVNLMIDYENSEQSEYTISNKMLSAMIETSNGPVSISVRQEISLDNILLLLVEDINVFSEYFDYKFDRKYE